MKNHAHEPDGGRGQAGFTLVETLVAIVVLVFGLMAVTTCCWSPPAPTPSPTRARRPSPPPPHHGHGEGDEPRRPSGGGVGQPRRPGLAIDDGARSCGDPALVVGDWHCDDDLPGVGRVHTHWWIAPRPTRVFSTSASGPRAGRPRRGAFAGRVHHLPFLHQLRPRRGWMPGGSLMRREKGFSLIELMIAMTVTLIVSGAIYGLLTAGSNAFRREPEIADRSRTSGWRWTSSPATCTRPGRPLPTFSQVFTRNDPRPAAPAG